MLYTALATVLGSDMQTRVKTYPWLDAVFKNSDTVLPPFQPGKQ